MSVLLTGGDGKKFIAFYENKLISRAEGAIGIARTLFVCIVLSVGSIFFTNDANNLVLNPIDRMLEKVKLISRNPLAAAN